VPREVNNVEAIWGKTGMATSGKIQAARFCEGTESWLWFPAGTGFALSGCGVWAGCPAQHDILRPQQQAAFAAVACGVCAQMAICAQTNARLQMMDITIFTSKIYL
jgi:hypothetical protein